MKLASFIIKFIGLRGEEAVSFLLKKRFRPVFKGNFFFFKFFLFINLAKLKKKFENFFFFRPKIFEKKIKICRFLGQKHSFLGIFSIFSAFFEIFDGQP